MLKKENADMMKLVDMSDLGSGDKVVGVQVPLSAEYSFSVHNKQRNKKKNWEKDLRGLEMYKFSNV